MDQGKLARDFKDLQRDFRQLTGLVNGLVEQLGRETDDRVGDLFSVNGLVN